MTAAVERRGFRAALAEWLAPRPAEVPAAKAAFGSGVAALTYGVPLSDVIRSPLKLMRQAQVAYHRNPWIRVAEATVTRRVTGLDWHLEDSTGEEFENPQGEVLAVRTLLERPQAALLGRRQMTRREMTALTSRHMGLCGMAHWFKDGRSALGDAQSFIYINPARMWAATDGRGNLSGWLLDTDDWGNGGIPLALDEVLTFYLEPPDFGHYGIGLYESAILKAQITNLADQHAAYVLGTGGRIAGIVSPKAGTILPETFARMVAEFRNVNEAPDAAKRTTILDGPIDFTPTAANPSELNLIELDKMNRDDILALWGVPPALAGVPQSSGGLNSGETRKYDEAVLMQGSVHDRVAGIYETIQYNYLDPLFGGAIELVIEEPEFDDRSPLFELAEKAVNLPMKNVERRELVGLPPFGDDRDEEVVVPSTISVLYDATGKAPEPPPQLQVVPPPQIGPGAEEPQDMPDMAKAKVAPLAAVRAKVERDITPGIADAIGRFLAEQKADVLARVKARAAHLLRKRTSDPDAVWRRTWDDALEAILAPRYETVAQTVAGRVRDLVPTAGKADAFIDDATEYVRSRGGERIRSINGTTRDAILAAINETVEQAIEQELPAADVARALTDKVGGLAIWDEARAELIARTETMFAYNDAALRSYDSLGVEQVMALDGDEDPECAERNGQVYPVSEAYAITDHPNGTLDWAPA